MPVRWGPVQKNPRGGRGPTCASCVRAPEKKAPKQRRKRKGDMMMMIYWKLIYLSTK